MSRQGSTERSPMRAVLRWNATQPITLPVSSTRSGSSPSVLAGGLTVTRRRPVG